MKNAFSYISSLIISVLLVFCIIGLAGTGVIKYCATENQFKSISTKYELADKTYTELEKYFHERSSATGIPDEVYMDAIDTEYLSNIIEHTIENGFILLNNGNTSDDFANEELELSIDKFFNDYAESINYKKDDKFEQKLVSTKNNAYKIIGEYCDVYKFRALDNHGVLSKISTIYTHIDLLMIGAASAILILLVTLLIINLNIKSETIYWTGVSSLIAGIIGIAPCTYLLVTDYFSSFSVKQAQIYIAYTETMKLFTSTFLYASIGIALFGILLVILYAIIKPKNTMKTK